MNRPLNRWLLLLTFIFIVFVAVSIPVLINYGEGQKLPQAAAALTTSTIDPAASDDPSPSVTAVHTRTPVRENYSTSTPKATAQNNCTYSAIYWLSNIDTWPAQFVVNNYRYTAVEALRTLQTSPVDIITLLFLHFNTAYLNIINGADPTGIENAVLQASDWLEGHPPGSAYSVSDFQLALQLAQNLNDFDEGVTGPGRCPNGSTSQNSQVLAFQVPVLSMTPSNLIIITSIGNLTPTPTATATLYPVSNQPTELPPLPTSTRKPGKNAPPPTAVPPPTSPPPTAPPPPTNEPPPTPPPP